METLIDVFEIVSFVFLLITLAFVVWRIWASLDAMPDAVAKIVKHEVQTRAKTLSADFLARLENPIAELHQAIDALSEWQNYSTKCAELEDNLSESSKKCAELASRLESEFKNSGERESDKNMAEEDSPEVLSKMTREQTESERAVHEQEA